MNDNKQYHDFNHDSKLLCETLKQKHNTYRHYKINEQYKLENEIKSIKECFINMKDKSLL